MNQLIVSSYDEFASYLGKKLGESDWLLVDQDRINLFADATLDHQWIHVDTDRAAKESPYGCTIAHGYLTLSLLPYMWAQVLEVRNISMLVNYGMDKMRFGKPVKVGSRVRLVVSLDSIENLRGICKAGVKFKIEIEGERKPSPGGHCHLPLLLQVAHGHGPSRNPPWPTPQAPLPARRDPRFGLCRHGGILCEPSGRGRGWSGTDVSRRRGEGAAGVSFR